MTALYVNLWATGMGTESTAHPSLDDALDDISSPAIGATYRCTLVPLGNGMWGETDLSAEADEYLARVNREWLNEKRHEDQERWAGVL